MLIGIIGTFFVIFIIFSTTRINDPDERKSHLIRMSAIALLWGSVAGLYHSGFFEDSKPTKAVVVVNASGK